MSVLLGGIMLDGFEVSARVVFGGKQALAVHRLPGGLRVVDAMGPDDDTIRWQGVLTGSDAADRARLLDRLRVAGTPVRLAWDVFSATVIVSALRLEFRNSWWIPYQIECTALVGTQPADSAGAPADVISGIVEDLVAVNAVYSTAGLQTLLAMAGALTDGSQANAAVRRAFETTRIGIADGVTAAGIQLAAGDLPTLVQAAGSLASLTDAAGFAGRANANFGAL